MPRINWVKQIVEKKTQTDRISADRVAEEIRSALIRWLSQKHRSVINFKRELQYLTRMDGIAFLKLEDSARLANKFTKGKMYNKHTMHPNDPTQTISPLKEDSIWSKKSPPHLPLCGFFCAYYGCPHPKLRRAKNKVFCKDSREICGKYGKQERVGLALCLSCVSVVRLVCPEGGLAAGPWDLSHSSYEDLLFLFSFTMLGNIDDHKLTREDNHTDHYYIIKVENEQ